MVDQTTSVGNEKTDPTTNGCHTGSSTVDDAELTDGSVSTGLVVLVLGVIPGVFLGYTLQSLFGRSES